MDASSTLPGSGKHQDLSSTSSADSPSAPKLGKEQDLIFPALLTAADQSINCLVMCDEVGMWLSRYHW
jgi:hypothetical protein